MFKDEEFVLKFGFNTFPPLCHLSQCKAMNSCILGSLPVFVQNTLKRDVKKPFLLIILKKITIKSKVHTYNQSLHAILKVSVALG